MFILPTLQSTPADVGVKISAQIRRDRVYKPGHRIAKLLILRRLGQPPARDLELAPPVVALGPQDRDGVPHDP